MSFKETDIIFLLGAGCSYEVGIPVAIKMVENIESDLLKNDKKWKGHENLYNYIKSAILYADGIFGNFNNAFNIERFVNVLLELEKKERNIVYPFIANWNNRLIDLAGSDFANLKTLKDLITNQLIEWIKVDDYQEKAKYYRKFYEFQKEFEMPLRVFTLNYDLCFEMLKPVDSILELGFDETRTWNSIRFEDTEKINAQIFLYKLHGSITWKKDKAKGNVLKLSEHPEKEPDLIFGTDTKLQSIDPYLYYVYSFRKHSLESKLIVIIGYSFSDIYINDLIKQALNNNKSRKIISVAPHFGTPQIKASIMKKIGVEDESQVIALDMTASTFLEGELTVESMSKYIGSDADDVF
jgi:hypothetical protein